MKNLKYIIIVALVLFAFSENAFAQNLQTISPSGFMMNPGDEEPPYGVYPAKTEGETDSLKEDTKKVKKKKKGGSKDMNGNPAGTIYWNNADKGTAAACLVGKEIIKKQKESAETTVVGTIKEVYNEVKDYVFGGETKGTSSSGSSSTTSHSTAASSCKNFEISLLDKPQSYRKEYVQELNKLSNNKDWTLIDGFYLIVSKNKIKKYFYLYMTKNKPSKTKTQAAARYRVLVRKNKIKIKKS